MDCIKSEQTSMSKLLYGQIPEGLQVWVHHEGRLDLRPEEKDPRI